MPRSSAEERAELDTMSKERERHHGNYDKGMWPFQKATDETIAQIPHGADNLENGCVPKWRCKACPVGGCSPQIWQKHRPISFLSLDDCIERVAYHIVNSGADGHTDDPDTAWEIAARDSAIDLYWIDRYERSHYAEPPSPPADDTRKAGKAKQKSRTVEVPPPPQKLIPVKKEKRDSKDSKDKRKDDRKDGRKDGRKDSKEKDERKDDRKHSRPVSKDQTVRTPEGASSGEDTESVVQEETSSSRRQEQTTACSSSRPKQPRILMDSASASQLALRTKNAAAADDHMLMNRAQVMSIADSLTRAAKACRSAENVCRTAQDAFRTEADNIIDSRDDMLSMVTRFQKS